MRLPLLLTSIGATAGLLLASALTTGSARAATVVQCPARLSVPASVAVTAPTTVVPVTAVLGCAVDGYVIFDVLNSRRILVGEGRYVYDRPGPVVYQAPRIDAATLVPGVHTVVGADGTYAGGPGDSNQYQLVWTNTSSVIKFGGMGGSSSSRSGTVVTVNGLFNEYRADGYDHPVGRTEYLQRYTDGGWRTIAAQPTNTAGRTSLTLHDSTVAQYRWASVDNVLTFGYSTPSTFR